MITQGLDQVFFLGKPREVLGEMLCRRHDAVAGRGKMTTSVLPPVKMTGMTTVFDKGHEENEL
jgi:hypothetical protein